MAGTLLGKQRVCDRVMIVGMPEHGKVKKSLAQQRRYAAAAVLQTRVWHTPRCLDRTFRSRIQESSAATSPAECALAVTQRGGLPRKQRAEDGLNRRKTLIVE